MFNQILKTKNFKKIQIILMEYKINLEINNWHKNKMIKIKNKY